MNAKASATTVNLTINRGITITTQPQPVTTCNGGNASFSVIATGYNLTYHWQEEGVNITDGGIYSGATTSTLTLTNPGMTKDGRLYRCVISTACGASPVNSTSALLTVQNVFIWTGSVSSDWNDTGNWTCAIIPVSANSVQIPDVANKPVLSTGSVATVNDLTIDAGASLTITGNTIRISGTIINNGSFNATDGTIEFTGTAAQTIGSDLFAGNTIKDLIIYNSAGVTLLDTLNISGKVSVQNGNLATGGYLILLSTPVQTAMIDGSGSGEVTGNVTMQRYLPSGFGYKYFSSPFQAATVSQFGDEVNLGAGFPPVYRYDENLTSSGWVRYNYPDSLLKPMHGYATNFGSINAPDTADITGVINNGPVSLTLWNHDFTYTQGFSLVGNPYPSPIDWDASAGWTKTNIDDAIYYFKASATDQYGGTYSSYIEGVSSDGVVSDTIPSMQGFFVHVSDGVFPVTGILATDNDVRITDFTHPFTKSAKGETKPLIRLTAGFSGDESSYDPLVICFDEKAQTTFDSQLDALKLMNTDLAVTNLYAKGSDGTNLSIDRLPLSFMTEGSVPLGLKISKAGNVVFNITSLDSQLSGNGIYLSDLVTGENQDLQDGGEYSVSLASGEYTNRFFLNITSTPTEILNIRSDEELFRVYYSKGILRAYVTLNSGDDGTMVITNMTGQSAFITKIYESGYHEFSPGLKTGIYIVTLNTKTRRLSRKVFIYE